MRRIILLVFFLFFGNSMFSQKFNGEYKSYSTNFKSEIDSSKNYKEKAEFNLLITDVYIVIQDVRQPKKPLIYKCKKTFKKLFEIYIKENCLSQHLKDNSKSTITFYTKENRLNLMVSDSLSSQVYFNLIKNKTH